MTAHCLARVSLRLFGVLLIAQFIVNSGSSVSAGPLVFAAGEDQPTSFLLADASGAPEATWEDRIVDDYHQLLSCGTPPRLTESAAGSIPPGFVVELARIPLTIEDGCMVTVYTNASGEAVFIHAYGGIDGLRSLTFGPLPNVSGSQ